MDSGEAKKLAKQIQYEKETLLLRKEFREKGVRFYDAKGWGFMRNKVKHYEEKW
jgi:hypothetical protein